MLNYELIGIIVALAGIFITVVSQGLYMAYKMGKFEEKINTLEKKQDKHNNVIERVAKVEASASSAHKRLDDGEDHFENLTNKIDDLKDFLMRERA